MAGTDNRHSEQGADWLARWFGPEVTEPVRLHVDAKRTCAPPSRATWSCCRPRRFTPWASRADRCRGDELARFAASPHAADACRVRRWDDAAKDPAAEHPPLRHFVALLRGLITVLP